MKRSTIAAPVLLLAAGLLARPDLLRAADCNSNGSDDIADIASGASRDCNANVVPDECELAEGAIAYEARLSFSTGFAGDVASADFDGDGDIDIVMTEFWSPREEQPPSEEWDPSVVFIRNLGGGSFAQPERYRVTHEPYTVDAKDLDGDADLDLLIQIPTASQLWVYLNDGEGRFGEAAIYTVAGGTGYYNARTADMDGDGDADVVPSTYPADRLVVLLNEGDGALVAGASIEVGPYFVARYELPV